MMSFYSDTQYKKHLIILFTSIIMLVASYFLFTGNFYPKISRSVQALWDLGHVVYFIILTLVFLEWSTLQKKSFANQFAWIIICAFILGISIEVLQYGTTRNPDMQDVVRDLIGSLIVLAFYTKVNPPQSKKVYIIFKVAVLILVFLSCIPLARSLVDEYDVRQSFPILSDLTAPFEIDRWQGKAMFKKQPLNQHYQDTLKITFKTQGYSDIGLHDFASDWHHFEQFNLKLFNPDENELKVNLRIYDRQHLEHYDYQDRFNRVLTIAPGWNDIKVAMSDILNAPETRPMNLQQIIDVRLFTYNLVRSRTLYLDSMYLSP